MKELNTFNRHYKVVLYNTQYIDTVDVLMVELECGISPPCSMYGTNMLFFYVNSLGLHVSNLQRDVD